MRILLIDDNEDITEAISLYCESRGDMDCQVVNNGQEGLERIQNHKFDLILLDLAMPDFSGLDVIQTLKDQGILESNNVVIFTASSNRALLGEFTNLGVKEVFKKPCSLDELAGMIEKYRPQTN